MTLTTVLAWALATVFLVALLAWVALQARDMVRRNAGEGWK